MISNSDIEDAKIEEIEEMAEEIAKELIEHLLNDEILIDGEFFKKH
jgi:nitrogenase subunit NifH